MEEFSPYIWQMWVVLTLIGVALAAFSIDRIPLELTSLTILAALVLFFYFFPVPDQTLTTTVLLSGLANPALITIMALLVIGQGLFQTEALEAPARLIARMGVKQPHLIMLLTFLCVMFASAFLNNTPVVVMFIPIFATLAARMGRSTSQIMMPLSFICTLGGMVTLIGSSTNLLAAEAAHAAGYVVNFFDLTIPGLVLAIPGALYVIFIMPYLLPHKPKNSPSAEEGDGKQFIAQITLSADNPLVGTKSTAGLFPKLTDITVRMIQRKEHSLLPPFDNITLKPRDTLILAATRKTLTDFLTSQPHILPTIPPPPEDDEDDDDEPTLTIAETVVAPASRMIGGSIEEHGFRYLTDCIVLGIQRRSRMVRSHMRDIRLEAGDVLLVLGNSKAIRNLRHNRDVLLLQWSALNMPLSRHATRALFIFGATVLSAATGLLPIPVAVLGGATAMILLGALNIRQATRALDRRIFFLIGAAFAIAHALEATGGTEFLASTFVSLVSTTSPTTVLASLFLTTAIATNLLSNNATALLFMPIAITIAAELDVPPEAFIFAVIFAANCSFATPIAYQTNLLVMGPGRYSFRDYSKAGLPLILILWLIYAAFAPWYYGLS